MRNNYTGLFFIFFLLLMGTTAAQTGCPGCEIVLPDLPEDTIYIGSLPNGTAQAPYSADLGFRLPKTTTPVAASGVAVPPGLNISSITITGVNGMPPGLNWEADETEFAVQDTTDGCVRICGTPLVAGEYLILVQLDASLGIFSQGTEVGIPLIIEPAQTVTEGFTLTGTEACGELTTTITNNVPSNGQDGFTYAWDFGNGVTTDSEDPGTVTYQEPGTYPISYQAIIDTTGFFLTQVRVLAVGCNDIFGGRPDLKINVFDPDNNYIYTSPIVSNAQVPLNFTTFIELGEGTYRVQVIDDDGGLDGADDECGNILITQTTNGFFVDGELEVEITTIHPVDTITSLDSVTVFPIPAAPLLDPTGTVDLCDNETIQLMVANYESGLTWLLDSVSLGIPDSQFTYQTELAGEYGVVHTDENFCTSDTSRVTINSLVAPDTLLLEQNDNVVEPASGTDTLTGPYSFSWNLDGILQPQITELRFCATESGRYTLVILDTLTGCSSFSFLSVEVDDATACNTSVADRPLSTDGWVLYPNPAATPLHLLTGLDHPAELTLELIDGLGRRLDATQRAVLPGETIDLPANWHRYPAGYYTLVIRESAGMRRLPLIIGR